MEYCLDRYFLLVKLTVSHEAIREASSKELDQNCLALIIGLSVYDSSLRCVVIGRLLADPPLSCSRKRSYLRFLKPLVPADVLFIGSGVVLFLKLYWANLFGRGAVPGWFSPAVIWTFVVGIIWLELHHAWSWFKSLAA
jgi:hypothetical protein